MTYKPVYIKWYDISTRPGWHEQEEVDDFVMDETENLVHQTGFLYEQDDRQVCVISSYFAKKDLLGDITKIPRGTIVEIKEL